MSQPNDLCGICKAEPVIPGDICDSCFYKLRMEGRAAPQAQEETRGTPAPGALVWTKEKPKADGFYWHRMPGQTKQSIDLVQLFTGSPCGWSHERGAWVPISWDLEWAGPIPAPADPEEGAPTQGAGCGFRKCEALGQCQGHDSQSPGPAASSLQGGGHDRG